VRPPGPEGCGEALGIRAAHGCARGLSGRYRPDRSRLPRHEAALLHHQP
jgi:hypothetical protein